MSAHVNAWSFQFTCPSRSTTPTRRYYQANMAVSIHVPLAEHDYCSRSHHSSKMTFQFTCPSRSTTGANMDPVPINYVSIHVPLAEHD